MSGAQRQLRTPAGDLKWEAFYNPATGTAPAPKCRAMIYIDAEGYERFVDNDQLVILCARCEGNDNSCPDCVGHYDGALLAHQER